MLTDELLQRVGDYSRGQHRGRKAGVRWAITWLHERARQMNDPHAQMVLNVAASDMSFAHRDPKGWARICSGTKTAPNDCVGNGSDV